MKTVDKAKLWGWIAVMLFLVWLGFAVPIAMASDDCKGHSCNNGGDVNVPVDVNTNVSGGPVNVQHKSDSLGIGLSNSLGDVDIAGCLGSTQWATPLFSKQKLTVNWPCMADFYLRNNRPDLAAMAICNTEVVKEFASEADCEAAHDFSVLLEAPPPAVDHDRDDELERRLEINQAYTAELESRLDDLETLAQRAPEQRTVVQQVPVLSDEQKAKLAQLRDE